MDVFAKLFTNWMDVEYLRKFILSHQRYLRETPFFEGMTVKQVIQEAHEEVRLLRKSFNQLYWNEINGTRPDLDDRFFILNRRAGIDDLKREMYGHPPNIKMMTSVLRLYAVKVPSKNKKEPAAYIITGGGIKLADSMIQMKELQWEYKRMGMVQDWLEQNKITTKEELIEHQAKYAEQRND